MVLYAVPVSLFFFERLASDVIVPTLRWLACRGGAAEHGSLTAVIKQDLLAGNSIVINRGDINEVWKGFVK